MNTETKGISEEEMHKYESASDSKEKREGYKKTAIILYGEKGGNSNMTVDGEFLQNQVAWDLLCKKAVDELNQKHGLKIDKVERNWSQPNSPSAEIGVYFFDDEGNTVYGVFPKSIVEYLDDEESVVPVLVRRRGSESSSVESLDWENLKPNWNITRSDQKPKEAPVNKTNADSELKYNK